MSRISRVDGVSQQALGVISSIVCEELALQAICPRRAGGEPSIDFGPRLAQMNARGDAQPFAAANNNTHSSRECGK